MMFNFIYPTTTIWVEGTFNEERKKGKRNTEFASTTTTTTTTMKTNRQEREKFLFDGGKVLKWLWSNSIRESSLRDFLLRVRPHLMELYQSQEKLRTDYKIQLSSDKERPHHNILLIISFWDLEKYFFVTTVCAFSLSLSLSLCDGLKTPINSVYQNLILVWTGENSSALD